MTNYKTHCYTFYQRSGDKLVAKAICGVKYEGVSTLGFTIRPSFYTLATFISSLLSGEKLGLCSRCVKHPRVQLELLAWYDY
jgi:hypothetical protein